MMIVTPRHSDTVPQKKPIKKFEDLYIWQQARELVKLIYSVSERWRDRSLQDQIRRAAVSVISNIAEGFERGTKAEFLYFLYVARGSCGEVRSQLYAAVDQKYLNQESFAKLQDKADYTSRLIAKFIAGYKKGGYGGQKYDRPELQESKTFDEYLKRIVEESKTK